MVLQRLATCAGGCSTNWPSSLNFAFLGTLTINGSEYPILLAQGHMGANNNWWVGAPVNAGWTGDRTGITTPDGKYEITPENGANEFDVTNQS